MVTTVHDSCGSVGVWVRGCVGVFAPVCAVSSLRVSIPTHVIHTFVEDKTQFARLSIDVQT